MSELPVQIGRITSDVEVRIRYYEDDASVYLCHAPITDLETVIKQCKWWGVLTNAGDVTMDISGQFVVTESEAFFEVIAGSDAT